MSTPRTPLRSLITSRRVDLGIRQEDLAGTLGVNQSVISRLESGALRMSDDWIERLLDPLEIRVVFDRRTGTRVEPDEEAS